MDDAERERLERLLTPEEMADPGTVEPTAVLAPPKGVDGLPAREP